MEEEVIIILTPPKRQQRLAEEGGYEIHVIGGELTKKQKRQILKALLEELKE